MEHDSQSVENRTINVVQQSMHKMYQNKKIKHSNNLSNDRVTAVDTCYQVNAVVKSCIKHFRNYVGLTKRSKT